MTKYTKTVSYGQYSSTDHFYCVAPIDKDPHVKGATTFWFAVDYTENEMCKIPDKCNGESRASPKGLCTGEEAWRGGQAVPRGG